MTPGEDMQALPPESIAAIGLLLIFALALLIIALYAEVKDKDED